MLDELYVAPAHRNRGVGTALLQRVFEEIRKHNAGELQINVDEVDTDARCFYERHGLTNIEQGSRMLLYLGRKR